MNCSSKTSDPLLRLFLDMRINPLKIARRESALGRVYVIGDKRSGMLETWDLKNAIDPPPGKLPKEKITTDKNQVLRTTMSSAMEVADSTNVLARIPVLNGLVDKVAVAAKLKAKNVNKAAFKLVGPTCERLKFDEAYKVLAASRFSSHLKGSLGKRKAYLVTGAWSARGLEVQALDDRNHDVDISAELDDIAKASHELSVVKTREAEIYFAAKAPLYFGLELMLLDEQEDGALRLRDLRPENIYASDDHQAVIQAALADLWSDSDEDVLLSDGGE